jgi:hypothetical protein
MDYRLTRSNLCKSPGGAGGLTVVTNLKTITIIVNDERKTKSIR